MNLRKVVLFEAFFGVKAVDFTCRFTVGIIPEPDFESVGVVDQRTSAIFFFEAIA